MDDNPKTILVVEDSPSQAVHLQVYLEQYGFQVLWAPNGEIGVLMADQYLPDAIVLDIEMPVMNGFEACKAIKDNSKTSNIPVVMLTVRSETDYVMKGLELGVVDFIPKDAFSIRVLLSTFNQLGIIDPQKGAAFVDDNSI